MNMHRSFNKIHILITYEYIYPTFISSFVATHGKIFPKIWITRKRKRKFIYLSVTIINFNIKWWNYKTRSKCNLLWISHDNFSFDSESLKRSEVTLLFFAYYIILGTIADFRHVNIWIIYSFSDVKNEHFITINH